jgi:hypothetical protein
MSDISRPTRSNKHLKSDVDAQNFRAMSFLREGGPLQTRRKGSDQYEMSISLPKDADGFIARECPSTGCHRLTSK